MQIVILVLTDIEQLAAVVEAWTDAGAPGITVVQSIGMEQVRDRCQRDDLPLFPSLRDILEQGEIQNRMLFTVVSDDALVEQIIAATEAVIGDLDTPGNGILFTLPVGRARGVPRQG